MADDRKTDSSRPQLKVRRVNLDTGRENVDRDVAALEGLAARSLSWIQPGRTPPELESPARNTVDHGR